jgi:hypothetical protein
MVRAALGGIAVTTGYHVPGPALRLTLVTVAPLVAAKAGPDITAIKIAAHALKMVRRINQIRVLFITFSF